MRKPIQSGIQLLLLLLLCGCATIQNRAFKYTIGLERGWSNLKLKAVYVDNRPMYYLEREGTGDTLVLVHGFRADKDNWVRFVRKLPKDFRVIAPDLPAHGDNFRDETVIYTPKKLAHGLAKIIDALQLDQFHLAGNSLGGWVTEWYTIHHPERVLTLGLFNSGGLKAKGTEGLITAIIDGNNPFLVQSDDDFDNLQNMVFYKQPYLPWPIRTVLMRKFIKSNFYYQRMMIEVVNRMNQLTSNELVAGLHAANVPMLVLWGDRDPLLPVSLVDIYHTNFPRAETVIMKNCGHLPMIERPGECARHYVQFISKHLLIPLKPAIQE